MSEEKRRGGGIIRFLIFLLIVYIVLGVTDYYCVFVEGNYTNGQMSLMLDFNGKVSQDEDNYTYRAFGTTIYLYKGGVKFLEGTIQNGVICFSLSGEEVYLYKDGNKNLDKATKNIIDYIRIAVSPLSKLIYSIANED